MRENKNVILEIVNYFIILVSILVSIFGFSISFFSNIHLGSEGVYILFGLPLLAEIINIVIQSVFCKDENEKNYKKRQNIYVILIIYTLALINLLFIGSIYRNYNWVYENNTYIEFIKESVNIIPFKTIFTYIERMLNNTINNNIVWMNILGNLILLMPLSYILPELSKNKINNIKKFTISVLIIAVLIEALQLIFMVGQVDIDDVLLNTLGAIIFYQILNIKYIKKLLNKFRISSN